MKTIFWMMLAVTIGGCGADDKCAKLCESREPAEHEACMSKCEAQEPGWGHAAPSSDYEE